MLEGLWLCATAIYAMAEQIYNLVHSILHIYYTKKKEYAKWPGGASLGRIRSKPSKWVVQSDIREGTK